MQVLKTTVKLRPGLNPYGRGWWSGWVVSCDSRVIVTSSSMRQWINEDVGNVMHWAKCTGGEGCYKSELVDD